MKEIMISIRPQWVAKILNGKKTIEIRKRFPSDYVGWVYVYCTKEQGLAKLYNGSRNDTFVCEKNITSDNFKRMYSGYDGKGKVVARFWCDKVEPSYKFYVEELCQLACISKEELNKYAGGWYKTDDLLTIHITKLEIFDKPKEISAFKPHYSYPTNHRLSRAPQSWCWIEV